MPSCAFTPAAFGLAPKGKPFDPSLSYITSPFFSARVLGFIRLTLGIYALVTIVVDLVLSKTVDNDANQWFSYFTHLSYIGLCAYFLASGVQSFVYGRYGTYPLRHWPKFLQFLHIWLYTTVATFSFIVTVVFWVLLSGPSTFQSPFYSWANISMHAMNSGHALFEILFTNAPLLPWLYMPLCVLLLAGYLGIAYITYANQHFYTYAFLDPKKEGPRLAAYIVGIAVGECIVYAIVYGIVFLRLKLTRKYSSLPASANDNSEEYKESLSEWQQMSRPSV